MQVHLLGPVHVVVGAASVALGRKERALLAALALRAGEPVSEHRLIEVLWGDEPPPSATRTLRSYVSRLRKVLATDGATVTSASGGYRLDASPGIVDAVTVEAMIADARQALTAGDAAGAADGLRRALAAWNGPSLGELAEEPWAAGDAARLEELRLSALEDRVEADLACGRHAELVGELEVATTTCPYRERLWAARVTALYRAGRQAEALRAFAELREVLGEDLGVDPSPPLLALERQVLDHDPALGPVPATTAPALPSGLVAFLLTDVVGSTRLWEERPADMAAAMERHDRLIAESVVTAGGMLLKSRGEGDATFSVFTKASHAARAAAAAQQALAEQQLSVRMAIHVGEAVERAGDYYGPTVNRAARLRSIGEGGEVLLSRSAAELLLDEPGEPLPLTRVGERQLKDLSRPETVYRLVLDGVPAADMPAPAAAVEQLPPSAPPLPRALSRRGHDVVRTQELDALLASWSAAVDGDRRAVLVAGEPGMGKTWLVSALAKEAHDAGGVVLLGRCDDELRPPFQVIAEAVGPLLPMLTPADVAGLEYAGELKRVARDTRPLRDAPDATRADAETEQWLLLEGVAELLEMVSRRAPILLVVDDVHWASTPTLLLLRHLLRSDRALRLLVVATYRHTELDRTHPLSSMLADLRREPGTDRLLLHGLDVDGVAALAEGDDYGSGALDAAALHEETGGNPLFVTEVLRHLEEDEDDRSLPESVREVISRRLSRLSRPANDLLRTAAVLGPSFPVRLLDGLAAVPSAAVLLDALDEAIAAGLLRDDAGELGFTHALVRQTLLDELSTARRVALHQSIVEHLERLPDVDVHVDLLAHHAIESAVGGRAEPAARHVLAAGEAAVADGQYEHAADLARRALDALETGRVDEPLLRTPLLVLLTRAMAGTPSTSRTEHLEIADRSVTDALATGSLPLLIAAIDARAPAADPLEGDDVLRTALTSAWERRSDLSDDDIALLLAVRAIYLRLPHDEAEQMLEEAERLATPDTARMAHVLRLKAVAWWMQARPHQQLALADRLEAMPAAALDLWSRNIIINVRAIAATSLCDIDALREQGRRETERLRRIDSWVHRNVNRIARAQLAQLAGRWQDLTDTCDEILASSAGDALLLDLWAALQLLLHRETGRLDEFMPAIEVAVASSPNATAFRAARSLAYAETGRTDDARRELAPLVDAVADPARDSVWPVLLQLTSEAAATVGDMEAAAVLLPLFAPWSGLLLSTNRGAATTGLVDQTLTGLRLAVGDAAEAVEAGQRAVEQATKMQSPPLRARALLWLGRAQGAAGSVEEARTTLTEAAAVATATQMAKVAADARAELEALDRVVLDLPLPSSIAVTDLVGRADAVAEVTNVWSEVEQGDRRAILVAGEPGIGKSALAGQMAAEVHDGGGLVLHGRCDEGLRVAYQPFSEALRPVLDALPVTSLQGLAGAGELTRLVPDLTRKAPELASPLRADADAERWALFQAVTELLSMMTAVRPVLLVIDDIHWAAAPSLQLLRHLVRSSVTRLLIVGTYRHTDVDRADDLADLLADLRRESGVQRVMLGGLDAEGMRDLVEVLAGEPLGDDAVALAGLLHTGTRGNPFFAVEVLRHLVETGSIYRTDAGRWVSDLTIDDIGLPESVREVLGRRLSRLSEAAQRALRVAAVVGPAFSLRLLEAVPDAADRPDDLLDAMDEAVGATLLVEERGRYDFAHALIRQVLLEQLTSTRRIRLHRRIGEAIEVLDDRDAHLDALAHHFAEAAFDGQTAKAADYALAAARQAQDRAAPEQAAALLRRGIEALDTEVDVDLARRADLGLALALVAGATPGTSREGIVRVLDSAIDDGRRGRAAHQLLEGVAQRMYDSGVSHRDAAHGVLIEEAACLVDPADARGRALLAVTRALWLTQSPDSQLETSERALEEARHVGDADVLVLGMNAVLRTLLAEPLPDRLLAVGEELLEITSNDITRRTYALSAVATALLTAGRLEGFHRLADDIHDLADATRSWYATYYMLAYEGSVALLEGRWADAERTSAALLEHGGEDADAFNVWAAQQGILHRERGTFDAFRPAMEVAVEKSPRLVAFRAAIALAHADAGRPHGGREQLAIAMSAFPDVARDQLWPVTVALLADAASAVGDTKACAELEPRLAPWSSLLIASAAGTFCWASADQLLGQLALTLGRADDAANRFRAAHALAERIGSPPFAARAQVWLGRALADRDPDGSEEALRTAIAIGEPLGMAGIVREAEQRLTGARAKTTS